jgi:hypothetical protein
MFSLAPVLGVTAVLLMTELSAGRTIDDLPLQILQGSKKVIFSHAYLVTQMLRLLINKCHLYRGYRVPTPCIFSVSFCRTKVLDKSANR